jgi:cytochrome c2
MTKQSIFCAGSLALGLVMAAALAATAQPALAQAASIRSGSDAAALARELSGGDAQKGRDAIIRRGCAACHVIAGVPGPFGRVGPPLAGLSKRAYIAGSIPNTAGRLSEFLLNPPALAPGTAMPAMGLSRGEAHDIARFLFALDR